MDSATESTSTYFLIVSFIALIVIAGCESPGSVGSDIGDSKADVVVDSFSVGDITARNFNYYSGGYEFFSAGEYNDPLLGNLRATGLIKPNLPLAAEDSLTEDSRMFMRLILEGSQTYGDSLADQSFDIYEIDELWRSNAFRIQNDIQLDEENGPLTSFTIGAEDSIDVELPSNWVDKYRAYSDTANADSLYERDVFGLALVPSENSNKIIAPSSGGTQFVIQNPVAEDTFDVASNRWAYMLERDNSGSVPQGSVAWHSTREQILSFELDLASLDMQGTDIARAELVFYQNNELSSADRPTAQTAQLHLVNPDELPENITPGNPIANGSYSGDDGAFHFSFTNQIQSFLSNGIPEDREFVLTLNIDGMIKTSIIHTNQASADKRPKLIITSLKNNTN